MKIINLSYSKNGKESKMTIREKVEEMVWAEIWQYKADAENMIEKFIGLLKEIGIDPDEEPEKEIE